MTSTPPLAAALRQLREQAGLSGSASARRAGLSQSKVSRAETGRFAPKPDEVAELCKVYGAPASTRRQLVSIAKDIQDTSTPARVTLQRGGWWMQERIGRIEASAEIILDFAPSLVVGLAQTRSYIEALYGEALSLDDRERTVQARLERQRILETDREIWLVHTEGALRWTMGSPETMVGQLDHLVELSARSNVHVGVIPWHTPATVPVLHGWSMYDQRTVVFGTQAATAIVTDPRGVREYVEHWKEVEPLVSWADEARTALERIRDEYRAL